MFCCADFNSQGVGQDVSIGMVISAGWGFRFATVGGDVCDGERFRMYICHIVGWFDGFRFAKVGGDVCDGERFRMYICHVVGWFDGWVGGEVGSWPASLRPPLCLAESLWPYSDMLHLKGPAE